LAHSKQKYDAGQNVRFIRDDLTRAGGFHKPIDILHLDGSLHYEKIETDFDTWGGKLSDLGVILLQNTSRYPETVGKYFDDIQTYYKIKISPGPGLGILSKNKRAIEVIRRQWADRMTTEKITCV
jgi:hypothetical protein